jgi:hypothetical protein
VEAVAAEVVNLRMVPVVEAVVQVQVVFYMERSRFLHYQLGQSQ